MAYFRQPFEARFEVHCFSTNENEEVVFSNMQIRKAVKIFSWHWFWLVSRHVS